MSHKEVDRAGVLRRVREGKLKLVNAAQLLGMSYRQAKRIWKRYQADGVGGLQHRAAGRRSNRAKDEKFRSRVLGLVRAKYSGGIGERFGPSLAAEHLASEDGIGIQAETLRLWMLAEGLWSRERKRGPYLTAAPAAGVSSVARSPWLPREHGENSDAAPASVAKRLSRDAHPET